MKSHKINKSIEVTPYMLGLPHYFGWSWAVITVFSAFIWVAGRSIPTFLLMLGLSGGSYLLFMYLDSSKILKKITSDSFPKEITND